MSAKARILHILAGAEARKIRFSFPMGGTNYTISHRTFDRVARAIRHDHVHINVTTSLPPNVAAQYHPDTDTLDTKPVIGRSEEGIVLHECTHAYFDITSKAVKARQDEAAAYVVDALYFRMAGLPPLRRTGPPHPVAGTVADALLQDYQRGSIAVPAVNPIAWANLIAAIVATPPYTTPGDPVQTDGSYLHDGLK